METLKLGMGNESVVLGIIPTPDRGLVLYSHLGHLPQVVPV